MGLWMRTKSVNLIDTWWLILKRKHQFAPDPPHCDIIWAVILGRNKRSNLLIHNCNSGPHYIRGIKEKQPCSTSWILCSYVLLYSRLVFCSCWLEAKRKNNTEWQTYRHIRPFNRLIAVGVVTTSRTFCRPCWCTCVVSMVQHGDMCYSWLCQS